MEVFYISDRLQIYKKILAMMEYSAQGHFFWIYSKKDRI